MSNTTITLKNPLDMHLHVRDADMLKLVTPYSSKYFSGALIMPNLVPPVCSKDEVIQYRKRIIDACKDDKFTPYMSIFFKKYERSFLEDIKDVILSIKLYPAGITTNSEGGVSCIDVVELKDTLDAMSDFGIPLCIHGESNGFVMDREKEFIPVYESLAKHFPKLKIIMEHITTKESVELVQKYDNLYATITVHHLLITLDDVVGGSMKPHLFCKPIAKRYEDRDALVDIAINGSHKVMFGSDSAPHPKHKKESCGCAAGVFSSSVSLPLLAELFAKHDKLENLQKFVSDNAVKIYNLNPIEKTITLENKPMLVDDIYEGYNENVVPFKNSETISWRVI